MLSRMREEAKDEGEDEMTTDVMWQSRGHVIFEIDKTSQCLIVPSQGVNRRGAGYQSLE